MFSNHSIDVSNHFRLEITPDASILIIWFPIFILQVLWMFYVLVAICRKNQDGGYLYLAPDIWPSDIFYLFIINNLSNIAWLFLFDVFLINYSLIAMALLPATLCAILVLGILRLDKNLVSFAELDLKQEIFLIRLLFHNGIGLYATWTLLATIFNLCMVLAYSARLDMAVASTVGLALMAVDLGCWFFVDVVFLDRWCRYWVVPYPVFIATFATIMKANWDPARLNSIFTASLLGASSLFLIVKLFVMYIRAVKEHRGTKMTAAPCIEDESHDAYM